MSREYRDLLVKGAEQNGRGLLPRGGMRQFRARVARFESRGFQRMRLGFSAGGIRASPKKVYQAGRVVRLLGNRINRRR